MSLEAPISLTLKCVWLMQWIREENISLEAPVSVTLKCVLLTHWIRSREYIPGSVCLSDTRALTINTLD